MTAMILSLLSMLAWSVSEYLAVKRWEYTYEITDINVLQLVFMADWCGGQQASAIDGWAVEACE